MGFLNGTQIRTKITIELPLNQGEAQQVAKDIEVLCQELAPEDIALLARAAVKPLVKKMALSKLREHV